MIHKLTGEFRFSSPIGTEYVMHDGKNVSLTMWEMKTSVLGDQGTTVLSTSSKDAMLYKVHIEEYHSYSEPGVPDWEQSSSVVFELTEYEIKDPEGYTKPGDLGKGLVYSMIEISEGSTISADVTLISIAEGSFAGMNVKFVLMNISLSSNGVDYQVNGAIVPPLIYVHEPGPTQVIPNGDLRLETAISFFSKYYDNRPTHIGTDTINTIDGNVVCDVYENKIWNGVETTYIGQSNGLIYLCKMVYDADADAYATITLTSHISP